MQSAFGGVLLCINSGAELSMRKIMLLPGAEGERGGAL